MSIPSEIPRAIIKELRERGWDIIPDDVLPSCQNIFGIFNPTYSVLLDFSNNGQLIIIGTNRYIDLEYADPDFTIEKVEETIECLAGKGNNGNFTSHSHGVTS